MYDVSPLYKADLRQLEAELMEDANRIFTTTLHQQESLEIKLMNPDLQVGNELERTTTLINDSEMKK